MTISYCHFHWSLGQLQLSWTPWTFGSWLWALGLRLPFRCVRMSRILLGLAASRVCGLLRVCHSGAWPEGAAAPRSPEWESGPLRALPCQALCLLSLITTPIWPNQIPWPGTKSRVRAISSAQRKAVPQWGTGPQISCVGGFERHEGPEGLSDVVTCLGV